MKQEKRNKEEKKKERKRRKTEQKERRKKTKQKERRLQRKYGKIQLGWMWGAFPRRVPIHRRLPLATCGNCGVPLAAHHTPLPAAIATVTAVMVNPRGLRALKKSRAANANYLGWSCWTTKRHSDGPTTFSHRPTFREPPVPFVPARM